MTRDDFASRLSSRASSINHRLRHVADDGEAAGHVAVERAIADSQFALVSSRRNRVAELVRERHQHHGAETRLDVLFGCVLRQAGENFLELRLEGGEGVADQMVKSGDERVYQSSAPVLLADMAAKALESEARAAEMNRLSPRRTYGAELDPLSMLVHIDVIGARCSHHHRPVRALFGQVCYELLERPPQLGSRRRRLQ